MTYEERAAGVLPHIDIAGTDFTIDWRLRQLRETESPWTSIDLKTMDMSFDGESYLFLYDTLEHREYHFNKGVIEMPEDVVLIQIPNELGLDPYAVALQMGTDPKKLIKAFPMPNDLKATVRPLSDIRIAELIKENRQRMGLDTSDEPGHQRPRR